MTTAPRFLGILFLVMATVMFIALMSEPASPCKCKETLLLMDTLVEVTAYGPGKRAELAVEQALTEMSRLAALLDRHKANSAAHLLNVRAGQAPEQVPLPLLEVIERAAQLNAQTNGVFDPSIAPVLDAYDLGSKNPRIPSTEEINSLLGRTGWPRVVSTPSDRVQLRQGAALDLGGIAKGYVVDAGIEILEKAGATAGLINAGGDLRSFGKKPDGSPFRIGVRDPVDKDAICCVLRIENRAVATSGDYERFFERNGQRWHHLLSPFTGRPARETRSATVITGSALAADALATTAFILGPTKGIASMEKLSGVEASLIGADGKCYQTSGFAQYVELEK